ncbi:hypothetical protein [Anaerophaga thermohalophila]|jgi:hypothetical protein|uniref:hypothetical protein n=1 Tax=Anaerophaga thermohalophila TaxID=177400 RepID=UPI00031131CB|nr:hypothetical protein [Anaerophaga thermohalophila]
MAKHEINNEDLMLKQFFKNSFQPDETPSPDFNKKVMDQVLNEWVSQSNYYENLVDTRNRWWIIPGVLLLFLAGFLFDVGQLSRNAEEYSWLKDLSGAFQSLYSWIEPIHMLVIGASLAIGLLLALDHFFKKLSNI